MEDIYGYNEPKPQLHNAKYLSAGIILSVVAAVFNIFFAVLYIVESFAEYNDNSLMYTVTSILPTLLFIGILLLFMSYIGNFGMQTLKTLIIVIIVLHVVAMLLNISYMVFNKLMFQSGTMSISQWAAITGIVYMVFNFIFWAGGIAFAALMIGNKTDFVGGIRYIGIAYLIMVLANIAIYFIRMLAIPYLSMGFDSTIDNMRMTNALLSAVSMGFRFITLLTFAHVFIKARRYKIMYG